MTNLVTTQWLADHLHKDSLVILDASWHLPTAKRDARAEFLVGHVPGARFFDLDHQRALEFERSAMSTSSTSRNVIRRK